MDAGRRGKTGGLPLLLEKVLNGKGADKEDILPLLHLSSWTGVLELAAAAHAVRVACAGDGIHLCSILNAKSGRCAEDCAFCAQSAHYESGCVTYPLLSVPEIMETARRVEKNGVREFCMVTSGRSLGDGEFETVLEAIRRIRKETSLRCNCSLGTLTPGRAAALAGAGIGEYNHNLETSPEYFPRVCTTHTFEDRLETVRAVKAAGMKACCGGIIGMGESAADRVEMAFWFRKLNVDCVTVNILNPRPGTPFEKNASLPPMEIIKTVAVFRLILPSAVIKIAGGREIALRSLQSLALLAGGNGMIVGGYLTTFGQELEKDLQMVKDLGFSIWEGG